MRAVFSLILFITLAAAVAAQKIDPASLSKTAGGQRIIAYFAAFNSGDEEKLRTFFMENIAPESLKQRPVEPRLAFHRQVKHDFQTVTVKQVLQVTDSEIKLLAQSANGDWIEYTFEIGQQPPNKIIGLGIEETGAPQSGPKVVVAPPANKAEFLTAVEKFLNEKVADDAFSGVVMVAKDDQPIFVKASGKADRDKGIANQIDTKFNLGSINKAFTRIAIGQLIQQGKIGFDDKLGKFLPDYPNRDAAEKVTIRHLVTMRSGIGDFFGEKFTAAPKSKFRTNADFIPLFADNPLQFEPGTGQRYSNGGYILLGAIIEKVSGKSYYDYVRENIFKVAGMTDTDSYESGKMPPNTASGYTKHGSKERMNNVDTRPARGSAAGGGYSTAGDLLKFSLALQAGKLSLLGDNGEIDKEGGMGIAGGADGINAMFICNRKSRYTVVVLSNYDPPSAETVGKQINDWLKQVKE